MYSNNIIRNNPYTGTAQEKHLDELIEVLSDMYGFNSLKMKYTLSLSAPECLKFLSAVAKMNQTNEHEEKMDEEEEEKEDQRENCRN